MSSAQNSARKGRLRALNKVAHTSLTTEAPEAEGSADGGEDEDEETEKKQ